MFWRLSANEDTFDAYRNELESHKRSILDITAKELIRRGRFAKELIRRGKCCKRADKKGQMLQKS